MLQEFRHVAKLLHVLLHVVDVVDADFPKPVSHVVDADFPKPVSDPVDADFPKPVSDVFLRILDEPRALFRRNIFEERRE